MKLKFDEVNYEYGSLKLEDINLSFTSGKIYAIICENSRMRKTLVELMVGVKEVGSGTIKFNDEIVDNKHLLKNAGSTIGNPQLIDNLTIYDNLKLIGGINNVKKEAIIDNMIRYDLDFEDDCKFQFLSLLDSAKAYLVQALMEEPEILILDDIVVCLDKTDRDIFKKHMIELKDEGKIIILLESHHFNVYDFCDVLLKVENNEVIEYEFN